MNALQVITPVVVLALVVAVWAALAKRREWLFFALTLMLLAQSNPAIVGVLGTAPVGAQWLIVPTIWLIAALGVRSLGFGRFRNSLTGLALAGALIYICVVLPLWSINGFESVRRALPFAAIVVLGYGCLGGALADSGERDALLNYIVAASISYALYQIATVAVFGFEATLAPAASERKNMLGYGRFSSEIMNACGLGHSGGSVAVIAIVRLCARASRRWMWGGIALVAMAAVVLTGTRGAIVSTMSALCMLLILVVIRRPTIVRWAAVGILVAGGAVYFRVVQEAVLLNPEDSTMEEFEEARWKLANRIFEMASREDWNPVLGAGAGSVIYLALRDPFAEADIEAFVVRVWFEWGIGGALYVLVLLTMSVSVLRHEMSTGQYVATPWIIYMWASSMTSYGPSIASGDTAVFLALVSSTPRSLQFERSAPISASVRPAETLDHFPKFGML